MFKKEIEINDKEDPQGLFVKTPCFGGKEDQTLEKSWRRSTETAQKSCITEELETSKVSFPEKIWVPIHIKYFCFNSIQTGVFIPESSTNNTVLQLPFAYDYFISESFFTKKKLPIPAGNIFVDKSNECETILDLDIQEFYKSISELIKPFIRKIKFIKNFCTVCVMLALLGVIFIIVAFFTNTKNWEFVAVFLVLPCLFVCFYAYSIKRVLKKMDKKAREFCSSNISKLNHLKISAELGISCVYINFYKEKS